MNILFLLKSLDVGGVEIVTTVLANKFHQEGHHVIIWAFFRGLSSVENRLQSNIQVVYGNGYKVSGNIDSLRSTIDNEKIDVVINQWALPQIPIKTLLKAKKGLNVKVISVYHNDPIQNARIQSVESEISQTKNVAKRRLLSLKKKLFRIITGYSMGYTYRHSDIFEVLSSSFVEHFKEFTKIKDINKLIVQTNPVSLNNEGFAYSPNKKEKELIYVGRLEATQKRVQRLVEVWTLLEPKFPEWRLTIIGDGQERENLERSIRSRGLSKVRIEGFQNPRKYYERASILLLVSEFEGFPLVLAECMSFGVVPVVYGSYSAVYDIIDDGKDGVVVNKTQDTFDAKIMAEKLYEIMDSPAKLCSMAQSAVQKSENYSIDTIYKQWETVWDKL